MKSPAFQLYPADLLSDAKVVMMTLEEAGAYVKLIAHCWLEKSLPLDMNKLARLLAITPKKMSTLWPALEPCFTVKDGQITQPRLEKERAKQQRNREKKQRAADARWYPEPDISHARAYPSAMHTQSPSSSISDSTTDTLSEGSVESSARAPSFPVGWIDHFSVRMHYERFHVGLDIQTQERMALVITDRERWQQAIDHWADNHFRALSVGRMVKYYHELSEAEHGTSRQSSSQSFASPKQQRDIANADGADELERQLRESAGEALRGRRDGDHQEDAGTRQLPAA